MNRKYALLSMLFILLLFISGCTPRLFLTKDNSYSIQVFTNGTITEEVPIQLSWNSNKAVLEKLLLEASFVMSDLSSDLNIDPKREESKISEDDKESKEAKSSVSDIKTVSNDSELPQKKKETEIYLKAVFPEAKKFSLRIDHKPIEMDVKSLQIEVTGNHPGRVILNQTNTLQGIQNDNLEPAFDEFVTMLTNQSKIKLPRDEKIGSDKVK